jgi:hypothetical protein
MNQRNFSAQLTCIGVRVTVPGGSARVPVQQMIRARAHRIAMLHPCNMESGHALALALGPSPASRLT